MCQLNDQQFIHLGDADIRMEHFEDLLTSDGLSIKEAPIDMALLNFPFITQERGRKIVREVIRPEKVAYMHFPDSRYDRFGFVKHAKSHSGYMEECGIKVVYLT